MLSVRHGPKKREGPKRRGSLKNWTHGSSVMIYNVGEGLGKRSKQISQLKWNSNSITSIYFVTLKHVLLYMYKVYLNRFSTGTQIIYFSNVQISVQSNLSDTDTDMTSFQRTLVTIISLFYSEKLSTQTRLFYFVHLKISCTKINHSIRI